MGVLNMQNKIFSTPADAAIYLDYVDKGIGTGGGTTSNHLLG